MRLPLEELDFHHQFVQSEHREISRENVTRIEKIFQRVGCQRLQEENVINAIIPDEELEAALHSHGMSLDSLAHVQWPQDAPEICLKSVKCLSGIHRIEAARNFLDENDKWWIVRLFSDSKHWIVPQFGIS